MKKFENRKQIMRMQTKINLPVDVIHGIKEDGNTVSRVDNNAVHGDVPIFVHEMVLVNVSKPNRQEMIPLSHEKHFANKLKEVVSQPSLAPLL
jgi:hypothetical protein